MEKKEGVSSKADISAGGAVGRQVGTSREASQADWRRPDTRWSDHQAKGSPEPRTAETNRSDLEGVESDAQEDDLPPVSFAALRACILERSAAAS